MDKSKVLNRIIGTDKAIATVEGMPMEEWDALGEGQGIRDEAVFWADTIETLTGRVYINAYRRLGQPHWRYELYDNSQELLLHKGKHLYDDPHAAMRAGKDYATRVYRVPPLAPDERSRWQRAGDFLRKQRKYLPWSLLFVYGQKRALGELKNDVYLKNPNGYGHYEFDIAAYPNRNDGQGKYGCVIEIYYARGLTVGKERLELRAIHDTEVQALAAGKAHATQRCRQLEAWRRLDRFHERREARRGRRIQWAMGVGTLILGIAITYVAQRYFGITLGLPP